MTPTQTRTVAFAKHILKAPAEHIALEPPRALLELLDVALEHLHEFMAVGNGWLIIELENLKSATVIG